ncbi:hypothetical protein Pla108_06960 [Botrimarina colliarenosi]|uniref:CNNM transmembrane domain-containing protein n=1 Tax=Botrimarina colliarenosi TaxID=2528001 RepID=A0A5C6ANK5_9BACT|nr:CNNM domain-containing protein [Botrimarina colliarenosi]TWT99753.1 hypothetical protein Pla108_06960 [Botrimarina colliarenosi]
MPLLDYWFELATMAALAGASAFFSGSEAALFSISRPDRSEMASGTAGERRAATLLARPERLLTAILFGNLIVNMTYYVLAEVVSMRLKRADDVASWAPLAFTIGSLLLVILLSEVVPKSLAVLKPRWVSGMVSTPLTLVTRAVDPIFPLLQTISDSVARLLVPNLEPEPYLELADLERAVAMQSGETIQNESLLIQERQVLHRLVELADTTAAELMRPRRRCLVVRPPVALDQLVGELEGVGEYVLVTEKGSDEIASALPINRLAMLPPDRLELRAEPLSVVPWCAPASVMLNQLREQGRRVAVVVNELGETIGIVPLERLLDVVLRDASRIDPHDAHGARLVKLADGAWEASGETPLKRIAKRLGPWADEHAQIPTSSGKLTDVLMAARSVTVAGLLQEELQRSLQPGDQIELSGLVWSVIDGADDDDAPLLIRIEAPVSGGEAPLPAGDAEPGGEPS